MQPNLERQSCSACRSMSATEPAHCSCSVANLPVVTLYVCCSSSCFWQAQCHAMKTKEFQFFPQPHLHTSIIYDWLWFTIVSHACCLLCIKSLLFSLSLVVVIVNDFCHCSISVSSALQITDWNRNIIKSKDCTLNIQVIIRQYKQTDHSRGFHNDSVLWPRSLQLSELGIQY